MLIEMGTVLVASKFDIHSFVSGSAAALMRSEKSMSTGTPFSVKPTVKVTLRSLVVETCRWGER